MTRFPAIPLPPVGSTVEIGYRRLLRPAETYRQLVLESGPRGIVTLQSRTPIDAPLSVAGATILEPGSPAIWFTFPGAWHDTGLFHLADGTPTGLYANILTPVEFVSGHGWETTDLCLDIWVPRHGPARLLDAAELAEAEEAGVVAARLAGRARQEAAALMEALSAGEWPPPLVREWSLARVRGSGAGTPARGSGAGTPTRESVSPPESSSGRPR